jgi:hypothetical protein
MSLFLTTNSNFSPINHHTKIYFKGVPTFFSTYLKTQNKKRPRKKRQHSLLTTFTEDFVMVD